MTTTSNSLMTSPKGTVQFLAVNNKVKRNLTKDSPEGYAVRIKFDGSTPEGAAWKKSILGLNKALVGVKHIDNPDEYTVRAFTQFDVILLDSKGNEIEDKPNFWQGTKATATMTVQPYTGNEMGGSLNLVAITLYDWDDSEAQEGGTSNREDVLAQIRAQLKGSN